MGVQKGSTVSSGKSTFAKSSGTTKSGTASRSAQRSTSRPAGRAKVDAAVDDVPSPRSIDATSLLELEDSADPDLDAKKAEQEAAGDKAAEDTKKKKEKCDKDPDAEGCDEDSGAGGGVAKKKGPKVTLNPKDDEVDHIKKGVGDDVRKIKGKTSEQGDFVPGTRLATRRRRRRCDTGAKNDGNTTGANLKHTATCKVYETPSNKSTLPERQQHCIVTNKQEDDAFICSQTADEGQECACNGMAMLGMKYHCGDAKRPVGWKAPKGYVKEKCAIGVNTPAELRQYAFKSMRSHTMVKCSRAAFGATGLNPNYDLQCMCIPMKSRCRQVAFTTGGKLEDAFNGTVSFQTNGLMEPVPSSCHDKPGAYCSLSVCSQDLRLSGVGLGSWKVTINSEGNPMLSSYVFKDELNTKFPPTAMTVFKAYNKTDTHKGCCAEGAPGEPKKLTSLDLAGSGKKGMMADINGCYRACNNFKGKNNTACNFISINPNATNGTLGWCTGYSSCKNTCKIPQGPTALTIYKMRGTGCDWQCYLDRYRDLRLKYGATDIKAAQKHFIRQGDREGRDCTCGRPDKCQDATSKNPIGKCFKAIQWMVLSGWTVKGSPYINDYKEWGLTRTSKPREYQRYLHEREPARGCPMPCPVAPKSNNTKATDNREVRMKEKNKKKDERFVKAQKAELAKKQEIKAKVNEKKAKEVKHKRSEVVRKKKEEQRAKLFNKVKKVGQANMKKKLAKYVTVAAHTKKKANYFRDMAAITLRGYEKYPKMVMANKEKMAKANAWITDFEKVFFKNEKSEKGKSHTQEVSAKQVQREKDNKWATIKREEKKNEMAHKKYVRLSTGTLTNATRNMTRDMKAINFKLATAQRDQVHEGLVRVVEAQTAQIKVNMLRGKEQTLKHGTVYWDRKRKSLAFEATTKFKLISRQREAEKVKKGAKKRRMAAFEMNRKKKIKRVEVATEVVAKRLVKDETKEVESKQLRCQALRKLSARSAKYAAGEVEQKITGLRTQYMIVKGRWQSMSEAGNAAEKEGAEISAKFNTKKLTEEQSTKANFRQNELQTLATGYLNKEKKLFTKLAVVRREIVGAKANASNLTLQYKEKVQRFGCGWMQCDRQKCLPCPRGLSLHTSAKLNLVTMKCDCSCHCLSSEPPLRLPEGMTVRDREDLRLGKSGNNSAQQQYPVKVVSQIQTCRGYRQYTGCINGFQARINCGCPSQYRWTFSRRQSAADVLARPRPQITVVTPQLPSDRSFSQWYRTCVLGEKLTNPPCARKEASKASTTAPRKA